MTKTVYVAIAPNGTQHTRATNRTYTHAVLLEGKEGWGAVGFCGRPDLAEKKCAEHPGSIMVECSVLGECRVDKPAVENTEPTTPDTPKQPKLTIGRFVEELLKDETLDYAAIVDRVLAEFPAAKTTARSVASIAAVLRRNGAPVPMRRPYRKS